MNLYLDLSKEFACVHIPIGKGLYIFVNSHKERRTQVVADVHQFEGHICDANSF